MMAYQARPRIQGKGGSQVFVGDHVLQIDLPHGGLVNPASSWQQPRVQPRPAPVMVRPRPFPGLLDREAEINAAVNAVRSAQPVEFCGQAGLGKTALLRHLAYPASSDSFPDGIVYLSARRQSLSDLFQSLWEAFYESAAPIKLTDAQIRHAFQNKRALILLDDVELARDEVETLISAAPGCFFLLTSVERRLWGEGQAISLPGLPLNDARVLLERELGRPLTPEEDAAVQPLHTLLDGYPLRLLQAAAMAREGHRSLVELVHSLQTGAPVEMLTQQAVGLLSEAELRVLTALAAMGGGPVHAERLAAVTRLADVTPALESLQRRGLVQAHSPRYSLTGDLAQSLQKAWDLTPWIEHSLASLISWAEDQRQTPLHLLEESKAILQAMEWAIKASRWQDVLRLGRAIEGALILSGRWDAWAQVLRWMLQAARSLNDRATEAWGLHQFGTRDFCLGKIQEARFSLTQALRIRESIGDKAGAEITRHNLNLLPVPQPASQRAPQPVTQAAPRGWPLILKGALAFATISLVALMGLGTWYVWGVIQPPTSVPVTAMATILSAR